MASFIEKGKRSLCVFCLTLYLFTLESACYCSKRAVEVTVLRAEMKQCTDQVQRLTREFSEMKKEVLAARKEVDTTRFTLTEISNKLKEIQ